MKEGGVKSIPPERFSLIDQLAYLRRKDSAHQLHKRNPRRLLISLGGPTSVGRNSPILNVRQSTASDQVEMPVEKLGDPRFPKMDNA
jgi:hypothetical protein